jgi:membrane-associated phospholipid phosphatase
MLAVIIVWYHPQLRSLNSRAIRVCGVVVIACTGLARIPLGVHTLAQVVLGLLYGVAIGRVMYSRWWQNYYKGLSSHRIALIFALS